MEGFGIQDIRIVDTRAPVPPDGPEFLTDNARVTGPRTSVVRTRTHPGDMLAEARCTVHVRSHLVTSVLRESAECSLLVVYLS